MRTNIERHLKKRKRCVRSVHQDELVLWVGQTDVDSFRVMVRKLSLRYRFVAEFEMSL